MTSKSSAGLMALLVIVLVDAGLVVWYWNRRQANQEKYTPIDINLAPAEVRPPVDLPPENTPAATPSNRTTSAAPSSMMIRKEPNFGGSTARYASPVNTRALSAALPAFWALMRKDRYRKSRAIRLWNQDFHSYPDLRTLNAKFQHDRDVMSLLVGTVQSGNFGKMVAKYGPDPDIQSLIRESMADPRIAGAMEQLTHDKRIMEAVKSMTIPGMPAIGILMQMGQSSTSPNSAKTIEQMKNDPNLKKFMEQQGVPPVSMQ